MATVKHPDLDFLRLAEAAGVLRCSEKTVLRLVEDGSVLGFRVRAGSSRWLIDKRSLLDFIARRMKHAENS